MRTIAAATILLVSLLTLPVRAKDGRAAKLIEEGVRNYRAHQYSQAVSSLEKATRMDPSSAEAFLQLGNAYYHRAFQNGLPEKADRDDSQNAVDAYQTALALGATGDLYPVYHALAQCQDALGRYAESLASLKQAAKSNPKNPLPFLYAARLRQRQGETEMSAKNFRQGVDRAHRLGMYPAFSRLVRSDPMFSSLLADPRNRALIEESPSPEEPVRLAALPVKETKTYRDSLKDSAIPTFRPKPTDPRDPGIFAEMDRAYADFENQNHAGAIARYREVLETDARQGVLDAVQRSLVLERIGTSYRLMGLTEEAAGSLEKSVAEMPQNASAHYQLALVYSMEGRVGDALTSLNRSLDNAASAPDLRKTLLLAKTDPELDSVRDNPRYREILKSHATSLQPKR